MKGAKRLNTATNGEYRIGVGYFSKDGVRQQKQFRLGRNLQVAEEICAALNVAWSQETTTDHQGKKVWSQEKIDKAFPRVCHPFNRPLHSP